MKPHPRPPIIRKTIKWCGAVVTVLLVVVWIGSYPAMIVCAGRWPLSWIVRAATGVVELQWGFAPGSAGLSIERNDDFHIGPGFLWLVLPGRGVAHLPLWLLVLFASIVTAAAWHLDTLARRRVKLNLCPKCGYDRTGLARDAKCPECGSGRLPA